MKRFKNLLPTLIIGIIFLIGAGIMAYPTVSDWWNRRVQSRAVASYNASVESLTEKDYTEYLEAARTYNEKLWNIGSQTALARPEIIPGYEEKLNIEPSGVIGSITIEKIDVNLPIYHGTSANVLTVGAGHLEGSSLPVGGENTHAVISAHRGLPRARLFTNLDKMEIGDSFQLHVLGDTLHYEVDQITVVLPDEMEEIYIQQGKDLCTLMTCTPYGINTHRLLVRGHRIYPTEEEIETMEKAAADRKKDHTWVMIIIIAALIVLIVIWLLSGVFARMMGSKKKNSDDSGSE